MNSRIIIFVSALLILIGGVGYIFWKNNKSVTPSSQSSESSSINQNSAMETATSRDGRVSFQYPSNWYLENTTASMGGAGGFGSVFESWRVTSFEKTQVDTFPPDSAEIGISIETGGSNLSIDQLVDCTGKMTCEKIGIDSEQFIKATGVLNTGATSITVATFYDDKILQASAVINPGSNQQELVSTVNQIFNSFTFSQ